VPDQRGQFLRAALGFAGLPRPSYDRSLGHCGPGSTRGLASAASRSAWRARATTTTHPLRRARLARDVLHDRDGALTRERDGHRVGAHALARDATGGVAGIEIVAVGIAAEETESDGESVEVDW